MSEPKSSAGRRWLAGFQVLRRRDFGRVWAAGLISQSGDFLLFVGLPFFVYRLTGSILATGTMFLASVIPPIVLGSVAGVFVDRWSRKWTMVGTNLLLGVGLLPLLLVTSVDRIWIVYAVAIFEACVDPFFSPAEGALIPHLVGEHDLVSANALYGSSRQIARLVGSAAGGVVVGFWGVGGVAVVDAATFFVAAALVSQIVDYRVPSATAANTVRQGVARLIGKFRDEWLAGLRRAARTAQARAIVVFTLLVGVGEGIVTTLFVPFIVGVLHGSGIDFGTFVGLQAVGGIAGAVAAATVGRQRSPVWLLSRLSIVLALLDAAIFTYPLVWPVLAPALVLIVIVGFPAALLMAGYSTLLQTAVPEASRGRFLGAVGTSSSISLVGGILLASTLAGRLGVIPMLEVQVGVYLLGGLLFPVLLRGQPTPSVAPGPEPGVAPARKSLD